MATLWVDEFLGAPTLPPYRHSAVAVSGTASTLSLSTATRSVLLQSDVPAYVLAGAAASTGIATSTSGLRIPASVAPIAMSVRPGARLTAVST